jgi:hypothetical protein
MTSPQWNPRKNGWILEIALVRPVTGDTQPTTQLARFEKRNDFTPELRRKVVQAARLAVMSGGPRGDHPISQAEIAELIAMFDGVVARLRDFDKRGNPDTGGSIEAGPLTLDIVDSVEIEMMEAHFRDCWVPGQLNISRDLLERVSRIEALNRGHRLDGVVVSSAPKKAPKRSRKPAKRGGRK